MYFFECDHMRPVARDAVGKWRHLDERGSPVLGGAPHPPFDNAGRLTSTCEAGIYRVSHDEPEHYLHRLVMS